MGNHQGTEESEKLAAGLRELEKKINEEKGSERAVHYPGSFQFVQSFTPEEKRYFFGAEDIDVKDSDNHTGANEQTEEDGPANGAIQAGPNYNGEGEGAITASSIKIDYEHPGVGQAAIPEVDTERSWLETVFIPLINLWKTNRMGFHENQALSPRFDRIQGYRLTAATYAGLWENGLARQEKEKQSDKEKQAEIIQALDRKTIGSILYDDRGEGTMKLIVHDKGEFDTKTGLAGLEEVEEKLENEFGQDAFLGDFISSRLQGHTQRIFEHTGQAAILLDDWIKNDLEKSEASTLQKADRYRDFIKSLVAGLQHRYHQTDSAMIDPGGIKLDNIPLERQGNLAADIVTDKSLEKMLLNARGLYGVIVGITNIPDLLNFIQ
jgi:hypothetical protein